MGNYSKVTVILHVIPSSQFDNFIKVLCFRCVLDLQSLQDNIYTE